MYYDFDFNRDAGFFEQSKSFKLMQDAVLKNERVSNFPDMTSEFINTCIKLWAESVIKHNLDINMTGIEHLNLISEQNSDEVFKTIGKIMFKGKHDRTDKEFQLLRRQGVVSNYLSLATFDFYDDKIDICSDLKKEFVEFRELKPETEKKAKP